MSISEDPGPAGQQTAEPVPGYNGPGDSSLSGQPRNHYGVIALVLGVLAVLLSWTVVGGIVLGIPAVIFGVLGRGRANRGEATNRGFSVSGIVLGGVGILIAIAMSVVLMFVWKSPTVQNYQQCVEQSGGDPEKAPQCLDILTRPFGDG